MGFLGGEGEAWVGGVGDDGEPGARVAGEGGLIVVGYFEGRDAE